MMYILESTPNHTILKYRCPIKKRNRIIIASLHTINFLILKAWHDNLVFATLTPKNQGLICPYNHMPRAPHDQPSSTI